MKIPTFGPDRVRGLSTETTARQVDPNREGQTGEALQKIGGALEHAAGKFEEALKFRERLKATNIYEAGSQDIDARQAIDPDLSEEKQMSYEAERHKLAGNAAEFVSEPGERTNFSVQHSGKVTIDNIAMRGVWRKKVVLDMKAQNQLAAENLGQDFISAGPDIGRKEKAIHELRDQLVQAKKAGVFLTDNEMLLYEEKVHKKWSLNELNYWVKMDPENVSKKIEAGATFGATPNQIANAKLRASINTRTLARETKTRGTSEAMDLLAGGRLTADMVKDMHRAKLVTDGFLSAFRNANPDGFKALNAKTDLKTFEKLSNNLADPDNPDPEATFHQAIEAHGEGKLSVENLDTLYKAHILPPQGKRATSYFELASLEQTLGGNNPDVEELKKLHAAQDSARKVDNHWIQSGKNLMRSLEAQVEFYGRVVKQGLSGPDIFKTGQEVANRDFLKRHPEVASFPREGRVLTNSKGQKIRYYPNGYYELEHGEN